MKHWGPDIMMSRRGLIAGAAGLLVARAADAALMVTPRQTAGPFYPRVKPLDSDADLTMIKNANGPAKGEVIEVVGRVLSVKGEPMGGAVVELWQADSRGRYNHPLDRMAGSPRDTNFQGYGAVRVAADGGYRFRTVRPRFYDTGVGLRTPHIHFRVVAQETRALVTQMYFPGEAMNADDFIYRSLASDAARAAVTARHQVAEVPRFAFDMVLA